MTHRNQATDPVGLSRFINLVLNGPVIWGEVGSNGLWSGSSLQVSSSKYPGIVMHEADEPGVVVGLLDADGLSGEHGTEVDLALIEASTAACGDDQRLRGDDGNMRI